MFSNRALQVRMVKSTPTGDLPETHDVQTLTPEQINQIAKEQVQNVAVLVGVIIAGTKLLNTVCEIATITAKVKIR